MGQQLWGTSADRRFFSESHWRAPLKWNEEARTARRQERVFCASMADVFERRAILNEERARLWQIIEATPHLDWLLLTKRPQHIQNMVPWKEEWPRNVWVGTSVENQRIAEQRLPYLLSVPARIRFLSCEPLLGPLDLRSWFNREGCHPIDWVIAGGESGHKSRPMHPDWPLALLLQCQNANVAFHFKQWGHWVPASLLDLPAETIALDNERPVEMVRAGKKLAGRILHGTTWDGLPPPFV